MSNIDLLVYWTILLHIVNVEGKTYFINVPNNDCSTQQYLTHQERHVITYAQQSSARRPHYCFLVFKTISGLPMKISFKEVSIPSTGYSGETCRTQLRFLNGSKLRYDQLDSTIIIKSFTCGVHSTGLRPIFTSAAYLTVELNMTERGPGPVGTRFIVYVEEVPFSVYTRYLDNYANDCSKRYRVFVQDTEIVEAWGDPTQPAPPEAPSICKIVYEASAYTALKVTFGRFVMATCNSRLVLYDGKYTDGEPLVTLTCLQSAPRDPIYTTGDFLTVQLVRHSAASYDFSINITNTNKDPGSLWNADGANDVNFGITVGLVLGSLTAIVTTGVIVYVCVCSSRARRGDTSTSNETIGQLAEGTIPNDLNTSSEDEIISRNNPAFSPEHPPPYYDYTAPPPPYEEVVKDQDETQP